MPKMLSKPTKKLSVSWLKSKRFVYLTHQDIKYIFHELNTFFVKHKDPVPEYNSSYLHKIDSVVARPQDTFDGVDLYPELFEKAACYFYFINKLHPFMNGNKRMSIVCTYVFLRMNGKVLEAEEDEIYDFAKEISNGRDIQDKEFSSVVAFITKHTRQARSIISLDLTAILERFAFWKKRS